jgi:hypothetical protein
MNFSCFDPAVSAYCMDDFRIGLDRFCDFIPIVSTFTNLIDLFQKNVSNAEEKADVSRQDSYWRHITGVWTKYRHNPAHSKGAKYLLKGWVMAIFCPNVN